MQAAGRVRGFVIGQTAADSGDLPTHRFHGAGRADLITLLVKLTGTGIVAVSLRPVARLPRQPGGNYGDDGDIGGQYLAADSVDLSGSDDVREYLSVPVPRGLEVGLKVTSISGTDAAVSVFGMVGEQ